MLKIEHFIYHIRSIIFNLIYLNQRGILALALGVDEPATFLDSRPRERSRVERVSSFLSQGNRIILRIRYAWSLGSFATGCRGEG